MLVAMVSGQYRPRLDGVSDYTAKLTRGLVAAGHRAVVFGAGRGDAEDGPTVVRPAARWDARGVGTVAAAIARLRPDVVHVHFSPTAYDWHRGIGLLPLLLRAKNPLVTTVHEYGSWPLLRPPWLPEPIAAGLWHTVERAIGLDRELLLLARASAALITTSAGEGQRLRARLHGRPAPTHIPIPANVGRESIDRGQARRELRERIGGPHDAEVVVFFGFLHPIKGLGDLFAAVAGLRRRRPQVHLLLVGGFDSLALPAHRGRTWPAELRRMALDLGLDGGVTFTGHVPAADVSRLLAGADVAALTSSFGTTTKSGSLMTVLEHRLPTVATLADPPDPELVHGRELLLVVPRDARGLAAALERLLTDRALARRLADGGRRLVQGGRSWEAVVDAHVRLYTACRR